MSAKFFGAADLKNALKEGATYAQVLSFLDENIDTLKKGEVPGKKGGIYEEIKAKASAG